MSEFSLIPHPDRPSVAVTGIVVSLTREGDVLSLRYTIAGDLNRVLWPAPAAAVRTDELWMHTCFEAFVQPVGGTSYVELNLSPSGRWATYAFDGHREGMRDARSEPDNRWQSPTLTARIDLAEISGRDWSVGLTAVVEAVDGSKSYWALAHGVDVPDFHDPDCFIVTLPAPSAA